MPRANLTVTVNLTLSVCVPSDAWDHADTLEGAVRWTLAKDAREKAAGRPGYVVDETLALVEDVIGRAA